MTTSPTDDLDIEGLETLKVIAEADRFNRWMFEEIVPFCGQTVLEVGSGIGNMSKLFVGSGRRVFLSDLRPTYLRHLESDFKDKAPLAGIAAIDLVDPSFKQRHHDLHGLFDSVVALNVIEHIENHDLAAQNCRHLLKEGGTFVMLVPAFQLLYNGFDEGLGHYRRYTVRTATDLLQRNGFEITHARYFNAAGILGWFASGTIMRRKRIPVGQMRLNNALVPLFRKLDVVFKSIAGLSVIVIGRKAHPAP